MNSYKNFLTKFLSVYKITLGVILALSISLKKSLILRPKIFNKNVFFETPIKRFFYNQGHFVDNLPHQNDYVLQKPANYQIFLVNYK